MAEYLEFEKVLDDKNIITVQTREYGSIEVIPVDTITDIELSDAQPVRRGRWIGDEVIQCSICNFTLNGNAYERIVRKYFKYCPYCGARMDGGAENATDL